MNIKLDYNQIYIDGKLATNAEIVDVILKLNRERIAAGQIIEEFDNGKIKRGYGKTKFMGKMMKDEPECPCCGIVFH